jgi:hypothetical protein
VSIVRWLILCIVLVLFTTTTFLLSCKADKGSVEESVVVSLNSIAKTYRIVSVEEGEGQCLVNRAGDLEEVDFLVGRKRTSASDNNFYDIAISEIEGGRWHFIINGEGIVYKAREEELFDGGCLKSKFVAVFMF